ncbi:MAG: aminomethyl-transferring glycine dehydrogenase subunit GcvPA [Thermoplasmata archaeon]|nr:aminomethyl-transferring glycine dehydrogenase subunit GcvPA [Thermoplasmata archaeon]
MRERFFLNLTIRAWASKEGDPVHYIPNTNLIKEMLKEMNLQGVEELFSDIPKEVLIDSLNLPAGLSEYEVERESLQKLSADSYSPCTPQFLGAGLYHHVVPPVVDFVASRVEFLTSYTPYQPEASQGSLQAMFEYQSMMASLTGMEVVNSSMYDGSTALGEALLMAKRVTGRRTFLLPEALFWEKRSVAENYTRWQGIELKTVPYRRGDGTLDLEGLAEMMSDDVGGLYVESPNFFGVYEESLPELKEILGEKRVLIVGVNPISLAIQEPPGTFGADIVIGEGQPLGLPVNYGGPLLGIFATRKRYIRKMPGRIIGMTRDAKGNPAFTMTLQTREQHIRRARATSNICSNEALAAITAAAYMATLGERGLKDLAVQIASRARWLAERIDSLKGFSAPRMGRYFFNEFTVRVNGNAEEIVRRLWRDWGVMAGVPLGGWFPELKDTFLIATTEVHSVEDYERLLKALQEVVG